MDVNLDELRDELSEYREQLIQVQELLDLEPDNEEYKSMKAQLDEAVSVTEEVLRTAQPAPAPARKSRFSAPVNHDAGVPSTSAGFGAAIAGTATPANPLDALNVEAPGVSKLLPTSVATRIRVAQVKAALTGSAPRSWAVGGSCSALYPEDGEWYPAIVTGVTASGFKVEYVGYGEELEVDTTAVRLGGDNAKYKGVTAPKMVKVEADTGVLEVPQWATILPEDSPAERKRKAKILKSYKSRSRFQALDQATKVKQSNWKSFISGGSKVSKKKKGVKKESMFATPEGNAGKVGVVRSGQGMSEYQRPRRHEFVAD